MNEQNFHTKTFLYLVQNSFSWEYHSHHASDTLVTCPCNRRQWTGLTPCKTFGSSSIFSTHSHREKSKLLARGKGRHGTIDQKKKKCSKALNLSLWLWSCSFSWVIEEERHPLWVKHVSWWHGNMHDVGKKHLMGSVEHLEICTLKVLLKWALLHAQLYGSMEWDLDFVVP